MQTVPENSRWHVPLKGDFGNLSRMVNNVFNGSLCLFLLPFNFSSEMKAAKTPE